MSELSRPNCLVGGIDMSHDFSLTDLGQEIPTSVDVPHYLDFLSVAYSGLSHALGKNGRCEVIYKISRH